MREIMSFDRLALKIFPAITLCILLSFLPLHPQKIKVEQKEGVTIIKNPKVPVTVPGAPKMLVLEEDLCIGRENENEDYMFAALRSVQVDDKEDIIVLDWKFNVIKVFDKRGKHVRTFGKHGQGPGELQSPSRMYLRDGKDIGILDRSNNRFSYYSKEGKCLKEIGIGKYRPIRVIPDSKDFMYGDTFNIGNRIKTDLIKFDSEFNPVMTVSDLERKIQPGVINPIIERFVYQVMTDDRFVWAKNFKYDLHIMDPFGKLIKRITKEHDPVKITEKEKKKILTQYGEQPPPSSIRVEFPKYYPPMYYFLCDEKGRIYVRTYTQDVQGWIKWDVFDEEGRYILNFFHPEEDLLFVIKNDKAYSMIMANEEGIPVIKRYRMAWE